MFPSTHLSNLAALQDSCLTESAWAEFQIRYRPIILDWCRRRGVSSGASEDVTQEILLKLSRALTNAKYDHTKGGFTLGSLRSYKTQYATTNEVRPAGGTSPLAEARIGNCCMTHQQLWRSPAKSSRSFKPIFKGASIASSAKSIRRHSVPSGCGLLKNLLQRTLPANLT